MTTTKSELLAFAEVANSEGHTMAAGMLVKVYLTVHLRQLYRVHGLKLKDKKRPPVHHMLGRFMGIGVLDPVTVGELRRLVTVVNKSVYNGHKNSAVVGQLIEAVKVLAKEHPVEWSTVRRA